MKTAGSGSAMRLRRERPSAGLVAAAIETRQMYAVNGGKDPALDVLELLCAASWLLGK
jgi:hypothetical protein